MIHTEKSFSHGLGKNAASECGSMKYTVKAEDAKELKIIWYGKFLSSSISVKY